MGGVGRIAVVVAAATALGGCLEQSWDVCDNGRICAGEQVCADDFGICVDPRQLEACAGALDGTVCSVPSVPKGQCQSGVCLGPGCGNGIVEQGEVCDDGNNVGGDGCNETCSSDESCGNALLDRGELCDCGNGSAPLPSGCAAPNGSTSTCSTECQLPVFRFSAVWGRSPTEVYALVREGYLLRYDGADWIVVPNLPNPPDTLNEEWVTLRGCGTSELFIASANGVFVRYDGSQWSDITPLFDLPQAVKMWCSATSGLYVVTQGGVVAHYDGASWLQQVVSSDVTFYDVWGSSASNVFAVGADKGTDPAAVIYQFDGTQWSRTGIDAISRFTSVWGRGPSNVFALGGSDLQSKTLWQFDGATWTQTEQRWPSEDEPTVLTGSNAGDMLVVGDAGAGGSMVTQFDGVTWTTTQLRALTLEPARFGGDASLVWTAGPNDYFVAGGSAMARLQPDGWIYQAPGGACRPWRELHCGDTVMGDTTGGPQRFSAYGCNAVPETGPEAYYRFVGAGDMGVAVRVTSTVDLDVYVLDKIPCDAATSCLVAGAAPGPDEVNLPGDSWVVVDGYQGAAGPYTLEVFCSGQ